MHGASSHTDPPKQVVSPFCLGRHYTSVAPAMHKEKAKYATAAAQIMVSVTGNGGKAGTTRKLSRTTAAAHEPGAGVKMAATEGTSKVPSANGPSGKVGAGSQISDVGHEARGVPTVATNRDVMVPQPFLPQANGNWFVGPHDTPQCQVFLFNIPSHVLLLLI